MSDETTGAEIVREIKERRGKTTWLLSLDRRREFCVHSRPDFSGRPVASWKLPTFADARLLHRDAVAHILQNGGYNPQ